MKYLLAFKGFCSFIKEWEFIPLSDTIIRIQRGHGLIGSNPITVDKDGVYRGEIYKIKVGYFTTKVEADNIIVYPAGIAGDSFTFSLPLKFHQLPQYHVHYMGHIKQCILVNDSIYDELRRVGLAQTR